MHLKGFAIVSVILIFLLFLFLFAFPKMVETRYIFECDNEINNYDKPTSDVFINEKGNVCPKRTKKKIHVVYYKYSDTARTVLFCHGTTGNLSKRKYIIDMCKHFSMSVVLFDYRPYGKSTGKGSTLGVIKDGFSVYNYVTKHLKISHDKLIIWGNSMGGIVASNLAAKRRCSKLILMSTFASINDAIKTSEYLSNSNIVRTIVSKWFRPLITELPTKEVLKSVTCPILIVHSKEDQLLNIHNAYLNKESCYYDTDVIEIEGGHTDPYFDKENYRRLCDFIEVYDTNYEIFYNILEWYRSVNFLKD